MVSEWEGYEDSIQHMKAFIQGAEDRMMAAQVEKLSPTEMQNQLQVAQVTPGNHISCHYVPKSPGTWLALFCYLMSIFVTE